MGRGSKVVRTQLAGDAGYQFYEDTNFVVGDSPDTIDVNADLGRPSVDGTITNDGSGNFTVAFADIAGAFGDEITMKPNDILSLEGMEIYKIRITHVADSAWRILVK